MAIIAVSRTSVLAKGKAATRRTVHLSVYYTPCFQATNF